MGKKLTYPLSDADQTDLDQARHFAHIMDSAIGIPGTKFRIGLDGIVGLIPGIGDAVTGGFALYLVVIAGRLGVPFYKRIGMVGNILIDSLIGAIPLVGDLFDMGFKANLRNMAVIDKHVEKHQQAAQSEQSKIIN